MGSYERRWSNHGTWTRENSRWEGDALASGLFYNVRSPWKRVLLFYKRKWRDRFCYGSWCACFRENLQWSGEGNLELDRNGIERRQPKLTEKSKPYPLTERKRETRNKLKKEIHWRITNIRNTYGTYLELFGEESVKLKEFKSLVIFMRRYKNFSLKKNKYVTLKCMTTCILK